MFPAKESKIGCEMGAIGMLLLHDLAEDRDHAIRHHEYEAGSRPSAHAGIGMIEQHGASGSAGCCALQGLNDCLCEACNLSLAVNVAKLVMQGIRQLGGKREKPGYETQALRVPSCLADRAKP